MTPSRHSHLSPILCLALLTVSMTSPMAGQSAVELAGELAREAATAGHIEWTRTNPLTWSDFRGSARHGNGSAAWTTSAVTYRVQCREGAFSYAVLAAFAPMESWVRPDIPGHPVGGARTLRHEQTHFDIAEVLARRLRRAFAAADSLCLHGLAGARQLFTTLDEDNRRTQAEYDRDTAHGQRLEAQAAWERWTAAALDSLAGFPAGPGR